MTPSWCWSCSNTHALYASAPASGGGACILAGGGSGSESPMIASGSGSGQLPGVRCGQAHPVDTPSPLRAARGHVLPHRLRPSDCRLTGNTYLRCLQDAFDKCGDGSSWESTPSTEQPPGHQDWGGHVRNGWRRLLRWASWWRFSALGPPDRAAHRQVLCPPSNHVICGGGLAHLVLSIARGGCLPRRPVAGTLNHLVVLNALLSRRVSPISRLGALCLPPDDRL